MALVLRQETYSPAMTKGSELSYQEGDNNLIYLDQRIESVDAASHVQNTDLFLASETANEVSAEELRLFIDEEVISLSDFNLGIVLSGLVAGRRYFITDLNLHVRAISINSISGTAEYDVYVPINDGTIGAFNGPTSYSVNDKVMYNWLVYSSKTNHTNSYLPDVDTTNWELLPTSDTTSYQLITNSCTVLWNKTGGIFQIGKKIDSSGNEHYQSNELFQEAQNILDYSSIFQVTGHGEGLRVGNRLTQSAIIVNRKIVGEIQNNILERSTFSVQDADFNGQFNNNKLYNVVLELVHTSEIPDQIINNNIISFSTNKNITIRSGAYLDGCVINDEGSTAIDQLDGATAVSGSQLFLNINGDNSAYGVYEIINDDVTIDNIKSNTFPDNFKRIILKPASGRTAEITTFDASSIVDGVITSGQFPSTYPLIGDNGDYVILEKRSGYFFATFIFIV